MSREQIGECPFRRANIDHFPGNYSLVHSTHWSTDPLPRQEMVPSLVAGRNPQIRNILHPPQVSLSAARKRPRFPSCRQRSACQVLSELLSFCIAFVKGGGDKVPLLSQQPSSASAYKCWD